MRLEGRLPVALVFEVCDPSRRIRLAKYRSGESGVPVTVANKSPESKADAGAGGVEGRFSGKKMEEGLLSSRIGDNGVAKKDEVSMASVPSS